MVYCRMDGLLRYPSSFMDCESGSAAMKEQNGKSWLGSDSFFRAVAADRQTVKGERKRSSR